MRIVRFSFFECEGLRVKVPRDQLLVKSVLLDRPVDGENLVVPVEVAENFEEFEENVHRRLQLVVMLVENIKNKNLEGVRRHAAQVTSENPAFVSGPRLDDDDALLVELVLPHFLTDLFEKSEGEDPADLVERNVDGDVVAKQFNELNICIDDCYVLNAAVALLSFLPKTFLDDIKLSLAHLPLRVRSFALKEHVGIDNCNVNV